jgi:hypothetical protein
MLRAAFLMISLTMHVPVSYTVVFALERKVDQDEIAELLLSEDKYDRVRAVRVVSQMDTTTLTPNLRRALFASLEREAHEYYAGLDSYFRGEPVYRAEDATDVFMDLARLVVALRDPEAIPALASTLGTGWMVIRALVGFGDDAIPAVLAVVLSPDSHPFQVQDGLTVLRIYVEQSGSQRLESATLDPLRRAALQRLSGEQSAPTIWKAIDLAIALRDPDLRRVVEGFATDSNAAIVRGITDPDLVQRTQKWAADRLAGVPATPRN